MTIGGLLARLWLLLLLGATPLAGQSSSTTAAARTADSARQSDAKPDSVAGTAVVFRRDTLFRLFGTLGPFDAGQRATAVTARLAELAEHNGAQLDSMSIVDRGSYTELVARRIVVMTVLDADASPLGQPRGVIATRYAARIVHAIAAEHEAVSARAILIDLGYAALASLALLVALWLLHLAFPRLYRRLDAIREARIPALRIQQLELLSAARLTRVLVLAARILRAAVTLVLLYVYVPLVLSFFPWTEDLSRKIVGYALTPLAAAVFGLLAFLPNLFYLLVIVLITRYVLKLVHAIFNAIGSGAITFGGFYPEWADPTYKIVRVLVLAFAAVIGFPYLPGAHTDAFKGVTLFLGVLFSLGSSSAVSNIVAGIVLTYTRAFEVGDRVKIGEAIGDVTERSLLVTRIRTIKNVEVTIPNGAVLAAQVLNYTRLASDVGLVLHTTVTIGYDAPWRTVHDLLTGAAQRTPEILTSPAPFVLQTSLDDFFVSYELNASTARADLMATTMSLLHENIQDSFNEGGVEIMSPHYRSLRDGNAITIPAQYGRADAEPGGKDQPSES